MIFYPSIGLPKMFLNENRSARDMPKGRLIKNVGSKYCTYSHKFDCSFWHHAVKTGKGLFLENIYDRLSKYV
jgi:hypothetical protein